MNTYFACIMCVLRILRVLLVLRVLRPLRVLLALLVSIPDIFFFTQSNFLENEIYTERRQFFALFVCDKYQVCLYPPPVLLEGKTYHSGVVQS